jgi:hypothetical protein
MHLLLLAAVSAGRAVAVCPPSASYSSRQAGRELCLTAHQQPTTWYRAKRLCIQQGETLLELAGPEDRTHAHFLFQGEATPATHWIGGNNHADEVISDLACALTLACRTAGSGRSTAT